MKDLQVCLSMNFPNIFQQVFPNKETSKANIHLVESFIRVSSVNAEIKSRPIMVPDSHIDLSNLFQDTILAETGTVFYLRRQNNLVTT